MTPTVALALLQAPDTPFLPWLPWRQVTVPLLSSLAFLGLAVLIAALFEWRAKADVQRYRSRSFLNDLAYGLFYRGGFHRVLIFSAIASLMESRLDFMQLGALAEAPLVVRMVVFWVGGDFFLYWAHRLQHSNRYLWAFHSVHHTQENLTTLTQYRRHPIDQVFLDVGVFLIFPLVLGLPPETWLPIYVLMATLQALQHAELDWRYGRLYPVVVSPTFHAYHHSADPDEHHGNFGFMFSIWDHVFGTVVGGDARPERFGVDDIDMPETLIGQFISPFQQIWRGRKREG